MQSIKRGFSIISAIIAIMVYAGPVMAEDEMLSGHNGNTAFITGGIGEEEQIKLEEVRHNYNVRITSSDKTGAYIGDTHITIVDASGQMVIDSDSGPLFYALVPDGNYTISATMEGKTKKKKIKAAIGRITLVNFVW